MTQLGKMERRERVVVGEDVERCKVEASAPCLGWTLAKSEAGGQDGACLALVALTVWLLCGGTWGDGT